MLMLNAFLALAVSVDRLYAIVRPAYSKMFMTYRFAWQICLGAVFLFGSVNIVIEQSQSLFMAVRLYVFKSIFFRYSILYSA